MKGNFVSVDSFLQELTQDGVYDSPGEFTISIEAAREKLQNFLLHSPNAYLLKLVQAGVAAGASELRLDCSFTEVRFEMRGCCFAVEELEQILEYLLRPARNQQNRALRHLAIGVNSAITTQATGISLSCWDGERGTRLEWHAGGRRSSDWKPKRGRKQAQVVFERRRTGRGWLNNLVHLASQRDIPSMFVGGRAGLDPDRALVMDQCMWCPVPLRLNGRWLPKPRIGPPSEHPETYGSEGKVRDSEWRHIVETGDPGIRCFNPRGFAWGPLNLRHYTAPAHSILAYGLQPSFTHVSSELGWLHDGVLTNSTTLEKIPAGYFYWGVLSAHDCATDLTGLRLVENERMKQLRDEARAWFDAIAGSNGRPLKAQVRRAVAQERPREIPRPPKKNP